MQSDLVTRVLLGAIVLCLLLLIGQRAMVSGTTQSAVSQQPRFQVQVTGLRKGGPLLVKTDLVTGIVWRKSLTGDGPWVVVDAEFRGDETSEDAVPPPAPVDESATAGPSRKTLATPRSPARTAQPAKLLEVLREEAERRGIDVPGAPPPDLSILTNMARYSTTPAMKEWAISEIAAQPPKSSVPALISLLDLAEPRLLIGVIRALEAEGDPHAIESLNALASHSHPAVRAATAKAVASLEASAS